MIKKQGSHTLLGLLALTACLAMASARIAAAADPPQTPAATAAAEEVAQCAECHEDVVMAASTHGPHRTVDHEGLATDVGATSSCTACHGDSAAHLDGGDPPLALGADVSAQDRAARCLSCHRSDNPRFFASPHAAAGMDCISCHVTHTADGHPGYSGWTDPAHPEMGATVSTCAECHEDVIAQFQYDERHQLQESILVCTTCHNPHEPTSRFRLGGFKQQECATCHADKSGPFVFEHGSVRVEGCVSCHSPHGSPTRHNLRFQNVAELCYSCHALVPGFHTRFTNESQCTGCHSSIHGSNFDPAFLK